MILRLNYSCSCSACCSKHVILYSIAAAIPVCSVKNVPFDVVIKILACLFE